jgi:uncharacterized protein (TIGR03437 family)
MSLTAAFNGSSKTVTFTINAAPAANSTASVRTISGTPKTLTAGSRGICRIGLDGVKESTTAEVRLSRSSPALLLPEKVVTRHGQSTVEFGIDAVSAGEDVVVAASLGTDAVKDTLAIAPDRSNPLRVPKSQFVKYGNEVRFRVSPADPAAALSVGTMPPGAYFDSGTGEFRWIPDASQLGTHNIDFTAVDPAGAKATKSVTVQVDSGEPVVTRIVNAASRSQQAACSAGAIAAIEGRWLINGAAVSDPSGNSLELAGAKVWVNGITTPVLSASATELTVLCPDSLPGTDLEFVVQTDHGAAEPQRTTARSAAPGIFSVDDSGAGQSWALLEDTGSFAMIRNHRLPSQPAISADRVVLYATGIDTLTGISVHIGEVQVAPASVSPVPNHPGLFQIVVSVPAGIKANGDLPIWLSGDTREANTVRSNIVTIAVEATSR